MQALKPSLLITAERSTHATGLSYTEFDTGRQQ
jgi:hypothetical protein